MIDAKKAVVPDMFSVRWDGFGMSYTEKFTSQDEELAKMMGETTRDIAEQYVEKFEERGGEEIDYHVDVHVRDCDVIVDVVIAPGPNAELEALGPSVLATEMMVVLAIIDPAIWKGVVEATRGIAEEVGAAMNIAEDIVSSKIEDEVDEEE
jgi:hypothetical protein